MWKIETSYEQKWPTVISWEEGEGEEEEEHNNNRA